MTDVFDKDTFRMAGTVLLLLIGLYANQIDIADVYLILAGLLFPTTAVFKEFAKLPPRLKGATA